MNKSKKAFLFPGQGSQELGMGRELYGSSKEVKGLFKKAEEITGRPIRQIAFEGPRNILDRTSNTQVALAAVSLGILAVYLKRHRQRPDFVSGHSAGEIAALVAAEALSDEDALMLMNERGLAMEEAGEVNPGGMAAILGMEDQAAEDLAGRSGAFLANYNIPDKQSVISGDEEALEAVLAEAGRQGRRLPVSIAAHSPMMEGAAERLRAAVAKATILDPVIPIISNRGGQIVTKAAEIKENLPHQLTNPVRWAQGVERMYAEGVRGFVEIGPRNVLQNMVRRHLAGKDISAGRAEDELLGS